MCVCGVCVCARGGEGISVGLPLHRCTFADSVRRIFPMRVVESVRSADHPFDALAECSCPVVPLNVSVRLPDVNVRGPRIFFVVLASEAAANVSSVVTSWVVRVRVRARMGIWVWIRVTAPGWRPERAA